MSALQNVVAAFSEEQTSRLTGITSTQLRYWDRQGFYSPNYAEQNRRVAFSRVYSFLDIVSLRVLNLLRNQFGVSLQHLREVKVKLGKLADEDRWIGTRLWVVKRKVVWQEPGTDLPQEIISGQYILPVVLEAVIVDTQNNVAKLNQRDKAKIGHIERNRFINHNAPVVAGTRIPVQAIKQFAAAGYSHKQIIKEYPDLTEEDVKAALAYDLRSAA